MALTPEQIRKIVDIHNQDVTPSDEEESKSVPVARAIPKTAAMPSPSPLPSPEPEEEEDPSALFDALLGAQEGFTFHLGKRGLAAAKAAVSEKTYEQELAELQKVLDEAKERSPFVFGGSELAGALLNPVPGTLAKMGAEAVGGAKLAQMAGKGAASLAEKIGTSAAELIEAGGSTTPRIVNLLEKPTIERIGELAGKSAAATIEGGLLSGAGEAIEGKPENIPMAMATGGLISSAFPLAGELLGRSKKALEDYDWFQKAKKGFSLTKEGLGINSISGQNEITKRLLDTSSKIKDIAKSTIRHAKDEFDRYIQQSKNAVDESGNVIGPYRFSISDDKVGKPLNDVLTFINNNKDEFKEILRRNQFLENLLKKQGDKSGIMGQTYYSPTFEDLFDLRRFLLEARNDISNRELKHAIFKPGGLIDTTESIINAKFPRFSTLKNNIDVAAKPAEMLMGQTPDEDARTIFFSNLSESEQNKKLEDISYRFLERYFRGGTISGKARSVMDEFFKELKNSAQQVAKNSSKFSEEIDNMFEGSFKLGKDFNPDKMASDLKRMFPNFTDQQVKDFIRIAFTGEKVASLRKEAMESAANVAALSALRGVRPEADEQIKKIFPFLPSKGSFSVLNPADWVRTGVTEGAVLAGSVASSMPVKSFQAAKQFNYDKLIEYANFLSKSDKPSIANIGNAGLRALEENPTNRAVFLNTIMSNPTIRQKLGIDLSDLEKEEEETDNTDTDKKVMEIIQRNKSK